MSTVRPSSLRKRESVLEAAERAFLRDGYAGASMDDVAALSGVSKQTVYAHFASKEALFVELVTQLTRQAGDGLQDHITQPSTPCELHTVLEEYGVRQLRPVLSPRILRLRRLVIGEVARFPGLGQAMWDHGPERAVNALTQQFVTLHEMGWLAAPDPRGAATTFNWLIMAAPLNRAMLRGDDAVPTAAALRRHCREGTRVFLAAYPGEKLRQTPAARQ